MKKLLVALAFALAVLGSPEAEAQFKFGGSGGVSLPLDAAGDVLKSGYHGTVSIEWLVPVMPISVRVDGSYHRLDADTPAGFSSNGRILAGTGNAVVRIPLPLLKPYIIGGVGYYDLKFDGSVTGVSGATFTAQSKEFGWNAGAGVGLKVGSVTVFAEARYHRVILDPVDFVMVPVSIGLQF